MCFRPVMPREIPIIDSRDNAILDAENAAINMPKRIRLNEASPEDADTNCTTHVTDSQREVLAEVGNRADDEPSCELTQQSAKIASSASPAPSSTVDHVYVADYASIMFLDYWQDRAPDDRVGDYLAFKLHLTATMRATVIDWLVQVHAKWRLYPEALFTCVSLFDRFLDASTNVPAKHLQLAGICCLTIAAKYENGKYMDLYDVADICASTYFVSQLLATEVLILNAVSFDIGKPTSITFLLYMASVAQSTSKQVFLAQYLLELSLLDYYASTRHKPLELAAAALLISYRITSNAPLPSELTTLTGLDQFSLSSVARYLCLLASQQSLTGVRRKFESSRFMSVALLQVNS